MSVKEATIRGLEILRSNEGIIKLAQDNPTFRNDVKDRVMDEASVESDETQGVVEKGLNDQLFLDKEENYGDREVENVDKELDKKKDKILIVPRESFTAEDDDVGLQAEILEFVHQKADEEEWETNYVITSWGIDANGDVVIELDYVVGVDQDEAEQVAEDNEEADERQEENQDEDDDDPQDKDKDATGYDENLGLVFSSSMNNNLDEVYSSLSKDAITIMDQASPHDFREWLVRTGSVEVFYAISKWLLDITPDETLSLREAAINGDTETVLDYYRQLREIGGIQGS